MSSGARSRLSGGGVGFFDLLDELFHGFDVDFDSLFSNADGAPVGVGYGVGRAGSCFEFTMCCGWRNYFVAGGQRL